MKIMVGSLGNLGYLVKPLPAEEGRPAWRRFEDEASLLEHLREMSLSEPAIRSVFRSVRAEGRAIVSTDVAAAGPRGSLPRRASSAHSTAAR